MKDIAKRFTENPILVPADLEPSCAEMEITCLLNPGVFQYESKTWLALRVAERPKQKKGFLSFPVLTPTGKTKVIEIALNDPELNAKDPRVIQYRGSDYLTTLSHLRLLCSEDGIHFKEHHNFPPLFGEGQLETFGIEDCRVVKLDEKYFLTFTSVSESGVGVGLRTTQNWKDFDSHGMILPPHNKDCAIFEEKINGQFYALHRPSSVDLGGNYIWLAQSPDGKHWGNHQCVLKTRPHHWDSARVGAGAAPIRTEKGWLAIYHGANKDHRYCLGAFLMDLKNPTQVIGRTEEPIMVPSEKYEQEGFFGHVVFSNGHVVSPDRETVTVYYGASDEVVCGAQFSIKEILSKLC